MVEGLTSTATDRSVGGPRVAPAPSRRRPREIIVSPSAAPRERGHADGFHWIRDPGDSSGEATPVPIPNTEVKLSSAENTERAAFREDRSSPGSLFDSPGGPDARRTDRPPAMRVDGPGHLAYERRVPEHPRPHPRRDAGRASPGTRRGLPGARADILRA
jgi:hypothetical protein